MPFLKIYYKKEISDKNLASIISMGNGFSLNNLGYGFMNGIAGVGYSLLRNQDKELPSVLLLNT